jgi:CheY-like chemotaxis protein
MPEMGGLEATQAIRAREGEEGGHVPIVALTAHAMTGDRQRCLDAGMDAYVSKPLRPEELFAEIDRLCGPPRRRRRPRRAKATAAPASRIDRSALLAAFGGRATLLADAIGVFLADLPAMMARLRAAADKGDLPELAAAAHAIKGSAGLFSQGEAFEAARRLEHLARGDDAAGIAAARDAVEKGVAALASELESLPREP